MEQNNEAMKQLFKCITLKVMLPDPKKQLVKLDSFKKNLKKKWSKPVK